MSLTGQQKRSLFSLISGKRPLNKKQLKKLEADANQYPGDAAMQLRFIKELNKNYPVLVIQRMQQEKFAVSEEIQKEYIKAMVRYVRLNLQKSSSKFNC